MLEIKAVPHASMETDDTRRITYHDIVRTGPGTLAGRFLRMFWQPVFVASELASTHAKPIRILGEEFTLYRGATGTAHVIDSRCAHRGVKLSLGRIDGDLLACPYHGWKYDATGQCVEQPLEPRSFCEKIKIKAYPTQEYLGLIFAYFGDGDPPELPRALDYEGDDYVRIAKRADWPCNFFAQVENSLDVAHTIFLHPQFKYNDPEAVTAEETTYGIKTHAAGLYNDEAYNTFHYQMPNVQEFLTAPPTGEPVGRYTRAYRVPIDDTSTARFDVILSPKEPEQVEGHRTKIQDWAAKPPNRSVVDIALACVAGTEDFNEVQEDPALPWISVLQIQDCTVLTSQEPLASRENADRLGHLDAGVALARKLWTQELTALATDRPIRSWKRPDYLWEALKR